MTEVVYIGDELTAAGYRLAGVEPRVATPQQATVSLREALSDRVPIILIGAACATGLDPDWLDRLIRRGRPLVVVVEDLGGARPEDLGARTRRYLGLGE